MTTYVFDIEADGLIEDVTKIHVLSYQNVDVPEDRGSLYEYDDIIDWLGGVSCLIGHNIVRYDAVVKEMLLRVPITARLIDTLALSWYLYPSRNRHGLEAWGDDIGIKKPKVDDWQNLSREEYTFRCESDVKINTKVWKRMESYLARLYEVPENEVRNLRIVKYLTFKMDCAREQEADKWLVDADMCNNTLATLYQERDEKVAMLAQVMPKIPVYTTSSRPAKPFKKDGTYSTHGAKWFKLLSDRGLDKSHSEPISYITGYKEPNPNSPVQIKDWLFSLGWEPSTFKYEREEDGSERAIPQIRLPHSGGELCPSVTELIDKEPNLSYLAGLSIITHRIGVFEGLLEKRDANGFVKAEIEGFTNTLRFKHKKPICNLPGVDKKWGKEIRGALIAREGRILCGADMVSLEATTKRHFMYPHDPEYADFMGQDGFDEHLDLAVVAGAVSRDDYQAHIEGRADFSKVRKQYKPVNYSAIYGIGAPKLARDLKSSVWDAQRLLDIYWERNWAIKVVAEEVQTKTVNGQKWLLNPISNFWYSLRFDKDKFSTLNQGSGSYCFDTWISEVRKRRKQMTAQFHDEGVWEIKQGYEEQMSALLLEAIDATNEKLKLNVQLRIDIKYGSNYAQIH